MIKTGTNRFFLLSVIFLHLCFFVWQVLHGNYLLSDSHEYLYAAANLKSDFLLYSGDLSKPIITELLTRRPPVYPLFLVACQMIAPGFVLIILLQNIFSITGIYIVRKIILNLGYSAKFDILFIAFLFFTPSQLIYANMIMSDTLFQFIIILVVWFFLKYVKEKSTYYGLLYSATLALSVLTKPVFVFFIFVNVLFFLWLSVKKLTLKPVLISLIPLMVLFMFQYRNYRQTGVFEVSSIVTANVLDFNLYFFLAKTDGVHVADSTISAIDSLSALQGSYKEKVAFKKQHSVVIVMKRPVRYAFFHFKGFAGFFLDPGRFDLVNFFNLNAEKINGLLFKINQVGLAGALAFLVKHSFVLLISLAIIFASNLFKFYCFTRFIFQRNIGNYSKGMIVFMILYVAFLTGPLGVARYMMPLAPLYIGCGLLYLSYASNKKRKNTSEPVL